jgi:hypothetical protein
MITKEAPPFHVWNEGMVHELVCHDVKDLRNRMKFGVSRCTDKDCDWCSDNRKLQLVTLKGLPT